MEDKEKVQIILMGIAVIGVILGYILLVFSIDNSGKELEFKKEEVQRIVEEKFGDNGGIIEIATMRDVTVDGKKGNYTVNGKVKIEVVKDGKITHYIAYIRDSKVAELVDRSSGGE